MQDPFTIHDFNWGTPNRFSNALRGVLLLPNNYAVSFEQINTPPMGKPNPPAYAQFIARTLRPWFAKYPDNDAMEKEALIASETPEIAHLYPELKYDKKLEEPMTIDQLIGFVNDMAFELEILKYGDTNPHKYIRQANVLGRNAMHAELTQDWKTPINEYTGEPDPKLLSTKNSEGWSDDWQP